MDLVQHGEIGDQRLDRAGADLRSGACAGQQCVPDCTSPTTTTWYLNDGASGAMGELVTSGSSTTWRTYIVAGGKLVAERIVDPDSTVHMRYFVLDHLARCR